MINITTEYSLLKSLIKIPELMNFASDNKLKYLGICDNKVYGLLPFYLECKKNNINPILGLDVDIDNTHIYLYVKNYLGYQKLLKINTKIYENTLIYDDLLDANLILVIPFEYKDIYLHFKNKENIYLGYSNSKQKAEALIITDKVIYCKKIRCLKKEEIPYLDYLKCLGTDFASEEDEYYDLNISSDDQRRLDEFNKLFNLEIPLDNKYLPKYDAKINSKVYLRKLALMGLEKRLNKKVPKNYLDRLNEELAIIEKMGFVDYFLIVYDYVLFAKKHDILVGPGRGSAAGSLVSYSIGITNIDPLKHGLLFARFLNPSRSKMPDIDIDFEDDKRSEVINYVKEKYGKDKVALGLTFNTYKSKLILRDLAKVLKTPEKTFEKFIKCIDASLSLKENLKNEKVSKYLSYYPELKKLYDIAYHFENLKKNISTHAAGVIISPKPLDEIIPIIVEESEYKTGYVLDYMEKIGLLKMDFLGLHNLSIIKNIISNIPKINLDNIPFDDIKTFNLFKNGNTDDIFQFESRYAKNVLLKLDVANFEELVIATALVRPGPSDEIDEYIKNKKAGSNTGNPILNDILKSTHGVIIFQEQVMEIFVKIAGYSSYEADSIRSSISKKDASIMAREEKNFINRSINNGYEEKFAKELFLKIKKFSEYGFNKSHAVSYATISYVLAYLKANYPKEFILAFLQDEKDKEKIKNYLISLKNINVKILKPNINYSTDKFMISQSALLLPLNFSKDISANVVKEILTKKGKGFRDIFDFFIKCQNVLNEKVYNALVFSGALDLFKINKHTLMQNYEVLLNYAALNDESLEKPILKETNEYSNDELIQKEFDYFGMYISNHPCSKFKCIKVKDYEKYLYKNINAYLLVNKIYFTQTKKGDRMAFINCSDETGEVELTAFSNLNFDLNTLDKNDLIFVSLKVQRRFDKLSIIVNNIKRE